MNNLRLNRNTHAINFDNNFHGWEKNLKLRMLQWKIIFFSCSFYSWIFLHCKSWHRGYYIKASCIANELIKPGPVVFLHRVSWRLSWIWIYFWWVLFNSKTEKGSEWGPLVLVHRTVIQKRWRCVMTPYIGVLLQTPYLCSNQKNHKIQLHLCLIICVLQVENNCWIN